MSDKDLYTVEKKDEIRTFGKDNEVETAFRIWATSAGGTYFHVEIHEDELDKADQVLAARAKLLDSIQ